MKIINKIKTMKNTGIEGIGLGWILFIIFLLLKVTENIDWSWWWVFSPLWLPILSVIAIFIVVFVLIIIVAFISGIFELLK